MDDPLMRPLKRGEIGVSFFQTGAREILPEDDFVLLDRNFQPGDICKRNINDVQSGVVISLKARGRVEHVISHERLEEWVTVHDLEPPTEAEIGDYVGSSCCTILYTTYVNCSGYI
jgi:ubiquitin-conjugating enzyme E2 O